MKTTPYARTQVLLEPDQLKALITIAEKEGKSLSGLLREWIDQALQQRRRNELEQAARAMMDTYSTEGDLLGYSAFDHPLSPHAGG